MLRCALGIIVNISYSNHTIVCYMGVLALTNNMITFTFFQSKITLSFALFQKCFSESAAKTLDSLGKVLYNGCDSFEKV